MTREPFDFAKELADRKVCFVYAQSEWHSL